jgi:hypothetical protein
VSRGFSPAQNTDFAPIMQVKAGIFKSDTRHKLVEPAHQSPYNARA